jgi:hypothetical protein
MSSQVSYDRDEVYGCHLWTGKLGSNGRPVIWLGRKPVSAHKYIYEQECGPVKDGMVLDHRCRNVLCVRSSHLEPVTKAVNEMRKSWGFRQRTITHCLEGHDLKLTGIVTPKGGKVCRVCK